MYQTQRSINRFQRTIYGSQCIAMQNTLKPTITFRKRPKKASSSLLFNALPLTSYYVGFSHDWSIQYDDIMDK